MKIGKYLLPRYFRIIGAVLLLVSLLCGVYLCRMAQFADMLPAIFRQINGEEYPAWLDLYTALIKAFDGNFIDELTLLSLTASLLFIAFSRERVEDEYVSKIRLESIMWAILADTLLIILVILFLKYDLFGGFMMANYYLILLLFIIKFRIAIFRSNKFARHEE